MRTLTDSQYVKVSERLLQSARQSISSKNSALVVTEVLRLFVNIWTPNDKYSLNKSECITQPIQIQLSKNLKIFSEFFSAFAKSKSKLEYFEKKWASEVICFWNYRLRKAVLLKFIKSPVWEHLWTGNMLNGPKQCLNLQGRNFVKFFDVSERKSAKKNSS